MLIRPQRIRLQDPANPTHNPVAWYAGVSTGTVVVRDGAAVVSALAGFFGGQLGLRPCYKNIW
jgi:hypothetical protein